MNSITTAVPTINVPFHGSELYVVSHNGEPYTPMKPIVEGMGMDWMGQYTKLKQRFSKGIEEISIPTAGGMQKMICLALRKLAAWLNTISPNKVRPEIRERVIRYQEECDDVLYEYWAKGQVTNPRSMEPLEHVYTMHLTNSEMCSMAWLYKSAMHMREELAVLAPKLQALQSPLAYSANLMANNYKRDLENVRKIMAREVQQIHPDDVASNPNWDRVLPDLRIH